MGFALSAVAARPEGAIPNFWLGAAAGQVGEAHTAEGALNLALEFGAHDVEVLSMLVYEHIMQGRLEDATRLSARVIRLDPTISLRFSVDYGLLAFAQGRYGEALRLFSRQQAPWHPPSAHFAVAAAGHLGHDDIVQRVARTVGGLSQLPPASHAFRAAGGACGSLHDRLMEGFTKAKIAAT